MVEGNPKWEKAISRQEKIYDPVYGDAPMRSEFDRDYTRIINCNAYRRLKHKTQVFFAPKNDHICTRIEHVNLVDSISNTIANYLGLNSELTKAIAVTHDIGHSPFGHKGESILSAILERECGTKLYHSNNGLHYVDNLELLRDVAGQKRNLNLTYAVRDGILAHSGNPKVSGQKPRDEFINLNDFNEPNKYAPYTWEACVVKIADKISYLGRDIIDAITLGIIDKDLDELYKYLNYDSNKTINNTTIINDLVYDLCNNSSFENGLCFSEKMFKMINNIKRFNYEKIYLSDKLIASNHYFKLILNTIYNVLKESYKNKSRAKKICPELIEDFENWLANYWSLERDESNKNDILFNIENEIEYYKAIIYYISGMTDNYAITIYNNIIGFKL
jgi:dGTPase